MSTQLRPGDDAPAFNKASTEGQQSLESYKGQWLVLYFYPKSFTPGCDGEACDFRDNSSNMDAKVLGVSPDSGEKHQEYREHFSLQFPLISDENHSLADAYGAWGEKKNYGKTYEGLIRSTFIISPDSKIAEAMYNVRAKGHVARVIKRLGELQA